MRRAALAVLLPLVAGCGAANIKGSTAERQIRAANGAYKKVTCPKDISAAQGTTFTCTATTDRGDYDVTVQIDSVDGGQAHMSFVSAKKRVH